MKMLFFKKQEKQKKEIEISFSELKQNIRQSVYKINEIEDSSFADAVFEKIGLLKKALERLEEESLDSLNSELAKKGKALKQRIIEVC